MNIQPECILRSEIKNGIHNKGLLIAQNFYGIPQQKPEPGENMDLFADANDLEPCGSKDSKHLTNQRKGTK